MADVRKLLSDAIRKKGLDMAKVSRKIGRNHAYIQQYVSQGKPKKLPEDVRHDLAIELGISEDLLREPRDKPLNQSSTSVTETGQHGDATEEQIMELVKFLRKLRDQQEDAFYEAVARLLAEKQGSRPQLVGRTL
jgi:cyanate lyase